MENGKCKRFDSKLYATELYLTTAYLLIDFLRSEDNLNPTEEAELCNLLYNAVLPGCYTPPTESGVPTQAIPLSEENFEDAVQQTISCMLGDYSKFKRMETGEKWPDTDIENGCYGYFHLFDQTIRKRICKKRCCSPWMILPSCLRRFVRMTARMQSCSRRKLSSSAKGKRAAAA